VGQGSDRSFLAGLEVREGRVVLEGLEDHLGPFLQSLLVDRAVLVGLAGHLFLGVQGVPVVQEVLVGLGVLVGRR